MGDLHLPRICSVDNCCKSVHARNLCPMHYRRLRLTGTTDREVQSRRCSVDGCENKHYGHGYCIRHLRQFREPEPTITHDELKRVLSYDPETGVFVWKRRDFSGSRNLGWWNRTFAGKEAGRILKRKPFYRQITVLKNPYYAHRLAWLYMTGEWPKDQVDHINNDGLDNRWCNLREATNTQNQYNTGSNSANKTGFKGVHFNKKHKKYKACISQNKKVVYLGSYATPEAAYAAYCEAARKLHGEFVNLGNGVNDVAD